MSCLLLLALAVPAADAAPIKVAVIDGGDPQGTYSRVVDQLNDSSVFAFEAELVSAATLSSVSQLHGYTAVVLGESGSTDTNMYTPAIREVFADFHAAGGGVVAGSWYSYHLYYLFSDPADFLPIVQQSSTWEYCTGQVTIDVNTNVTHPIIDGVSDFVSTAGYWEAPGPLRQGAVKLATCEGGKPGLVALDASSLGGRSVYLGALFAGSATAYQNEGLRSGVQDQLIEQAVAWASGQCRDGDGDGAFDCSVDCDDADPSTYVGATEICDGVDNDCDGLVPVDEADDDGDGQRVCDGDCDDAASTTYGGASERCDGIDNDCDGSLPADEVDADLDGVFVCDGDCDDVDELTFPEADELCDDIDNDCDGVIDNGIELSSLYVDADGDGFGDDAAEPREECGPVEGYVLEAGDCDDADPDVYPGAVELSDNGIDEDCDGDDAPAEQETGAGDTGSEPRVERCGCATAAPAGVLVWLLLPLLGVVRRRLA